MVRGQAGREGFVDRERWRAAEAGPYHHRPHTPEDRIDAYALLGQVAENTIANIVDPAYTVVAKVRKRYLR